MKRKGFAAIAVLFLMSFLLSHYVSAFQVSNKNIKTTVRLMSRTFVPAVGIDNGLAKYIQSRIKEKYDYIHVIVQFQTIPDLQKRKQLEDMKLRLLDPIPERAFYASIPAGLTLPRRLITGKHVRWIGPIQSNDKIAPWILKKGIPEHAKRPKNKAAVIVEFFGDVREAEQIKALKKYDVQLTNQILPLNGWHVTIGVSDIPKLAKEDVVKWIVEVPPPQEDLNDGVRSNTGVNADPVLPPSAYNLTGAGVIVAQWETRHASYTHNDFSARITLADPPLPRTDRSYTHNEAVSVNGRFDNGEEIYWDVDDNGIVSVGDIRATTVGALLPGSIVSAGPPADPDIGVNLIPFMQFINYGIAFEGYTDNITVNGQYTEGEGIYFDADGDAQVSAGDTRMTAVGAYAAGSIVSEGSAGPPPVPADADVGLLFNDLIFNPHYHSTHVAGMVIGDGSRSVANGGTPNQWKGVAPGASIRSYSGFPPTGSVSGSPTGTDEYFDAASNGVSISTNSWRTSRIYQITAPHTGYEIGSQYYDAVISGRRSDGTASALPRRILVVVAAGNEGRVTERYVDNSPANGQFDNGETIYQDVDRNGTVTAGDAVLRGAAQPNGTALSNFYSTILHDETISTAGTYNDGEGIYIDADASRTVTAGDTRITAPTGSGFANGSVVAAGNADVNRLLKWFRPFATLGIPNSSKNTLEIASIASDTKVISDYSSRGFTYDGRFKPDVAAPGSQDFGDLGVTSTWPGNGYETISGTSMSTPAVSGCAALLEEWYNTALSNIDPSPELMRALIIHSAEDLTDIPTYGNGYIGPDFAFGYGRVRAKEAVDLMPHFINGTAAALGTTNYTFKIGKMDSLKVSLVWCDPPWTASTAPSAATGILRNDLDLLLIAPDGTQYTPWVADPANLFAPAVRSTVPAATPIPAAAVDHRNTVEQVYVDDPIAGTWTISVTASTLNLPSQDYVIVSEALPPNNTVCTLSAADIWVKDNPTDVGTVPSSGAMYLGPDIWNRVAPDGLTDHQNPVFGQANYLYANIRNNSAVIVKSAEIDAWISTLAIGLVWPSGFVHVGRFNIQNLAASETRQVGPIIWSPQEVGHHCMYTRASSPQDPITFVETNSVWTNAMNSNNIAYRNMTVVDLASEKSVSFLVRNTEKNDSDLDVIIDIPQKYLEKGDVHMMLSPELDKAWPVKNRSIQGLEVAKNRRFIFMEKMEAQDQKSEPKRKDKKKEQYIEPREIELRVPIYKIRTNKLVLKNLHMRTQQAEKMMLTFSSKDTAKTVTEIHVTQAVAGKVKDGILFVVRTGYAKK